MPIITLTEKKFNDFSKKHKKRNYKQTIEYANVMQRQGYDILYLGLEEDNNIIAGTLILSKKVLNKYRIGYVPDGYLLDFEDYLLLEKFTKELKAYLHKLDYIYLTIEPNFAYRVFDKNNLEVKCYPENINNLKDLGYVHLGFNYIFNRYNAILNIQDDLEKTYKLFNRSIKRKIKDSNLMGITFYQENNLNIFYKLIEKKERQNIEYYMNLLNVFKDDECKFEIYFAKLNPEVYLNNFRYILKKEQEKNIKLQELIKDIKAPKTKKLIDKKITSDKLLNKYQNKVIEASKIFSEYPNGLIIGTCAIIKKNKTVYFVEEGYEEKLRNIYSLSMLKWEIIKKYYHMGYKNIDLGLIPYFKDKGDKYHGIYLSKIGFNPKIYECAGKFDLVINKYIYSIMNKLPKKK